MASHRIARTVAVAFAAAALTGAAEPRGAAPDPRHGEALYVGIAPLAGGGAPCLACHAVAGHGLARAASFGPDLTGAHAQYGTDGLQAILEDVTFPSMAPIYRNHAVTPAERADLAAFLAEASGAPPPALGARFAAGVAVAAAGFLAFVSLLAARGRWRRGHAATSGRTA